MRIALMHYSVPPVVGGVESVLAHHAGLMADAGHQVRVIAARGGQFDARVEFIQMPLVDSRGDRVLAVKRELDQGRVPPDFADLTATLAADLALALASTDILIAHNICSLNKNLALTAALHELASRSDMPRFILWHHDLAWTTPRYRSELHDGWPWSLLRTDWPQATQVAVSTLRQRELAELLGVSLERILVMPNGLDVDAFLKLEPETADLIRLLDLLEADPLLLLPVRITRRKNIELAVRVVGALRELLPNPVLVVTGPPGPHNLANVEYFARLRLLRADLGLEGSVHFLAEVVEGSIANPVIADLYRLADALIFPSREEGFGIPVLEAGLCRMPIFCADIPPLRELGGDMATYFSPDADPAAVAGAIAERLADDPVYRMARHVREDYTWEGVYANRIAPLLEAGRSP